MGKSGELSGGVDGGGTRRFGEFLFAWGKGSRNITHFGLFLLGSLLLHILGFYLFQVVYPSTGFLEPIPLKLTLLDESRPSVGALLREIEDRLVYLRPASFKAETRAELSDYAVRFDPSFSGRTLEFRPPPGVNFSSDFSGITGGSFSIAVLPPIEAEPGRAASKPQGGAGNPRWAVGGGLKGRLVLNPQQFQEALPELKEPPAIALLLGVGPEGAVKFVLPRSGGARPDFAVVAAVVRQRLKFDARPGTGIAWGELVIDR